MIEDENILKEKKLMKRTNYFYPIQLLSRLKIASTQTGLSASEIIRRAIDEKLQSMKI